MPTYTTKKYRSFTKSNTIKRITSASQKQVYVGLLFYIILHSAQAITTPMRVQNKEMGIVRFKRLTAQFDR